MKRLDQKKLGSELIIRKKNEQVDYRHWNRMATGAPAYGTNSLNGGFSSQFVTLSAKMGLYGGKQGAALQNTIHKYVAPTPLFPHNISYFGKPFYEMSVLAGQSGIRDLSK